MKIEIKMGRPSKQFPFAHFFFVDNMGFQIRWKPYVDANGEPLVFLMLKEAVIYIKRNGDIAIARPTGPKGTLHAQ